jgi:uncharacterized protein (DUF2267 family)
LILLNIAAGLLVHNTPVKRSRAMSTGSIDQIERSIHTTNTWLDELDEIMGWKNRPRSWRLLRVTLHALRDWLSVNEAVQLGAQLPMLIRGLYFEGWRPAQTPVKARKLSDFCARIEKAFETDPPDNVEDHIARVFQFLSRHVSEGELDEVRQALPPDIRRLWEQ